MAIQGLPVPFRVPVESVERAIATSEKFISAWIGFRGVGDPSVARGLGALAELYVAIGNISKAESLYDQAQSILEKNGGTARDLGWIHNNRGMTLLGARRLSEAAFSFRSALDALGTKGTDLQERRAIVWQNLANSYHLLGNWESSEAAYLKSLDILHGLKKERSRVFQNTSNNLALLYSSIGDFSTAKQILEDLLDRDWIWNPTQRFIVLNDLGRILGVLRRFPEAESRLSEALALAKPKDRRAIVLMNLAANHGEAGDFARARKEADEALGLFKEIDGPDSPSIAMVEASLGTLAFFDGDLGAAETLLAKSKATLVRGNVRERWYLPEIDRGLALIAHRQGRHERALELSRQALDQEIEKLEQILAFGSEAQRLAYQQNAYLYDYLAEIGDPRLLAEAVLRLKGVVLESLLEERSLVRRAVSPEDRERLDRLHGLKVAAMESLALSSTGQVDAERARTLKDEETALAKSVGALGRAERPPFDLGRIQEALEPNQVLVELMRFQVYEKRGRLESHYGAVILPRVGSPRWVPLGKSDALEDSIDRLVAAMGGGSRAAVPDLARGAESAETILRGLFDRLWSPLAAKFPPSAKSVLISPDGALHFVPWAALVDGKGAFVGSTWQISQVTSGRDLLRSSRGPVNKTLLALADGAGDLPYARQEVERLVESARAGGWTPTVLSGEGASEPALFSHRRPGILHLATHGGQLGGETSSAIESRMSRVPMYRGFVLLGGGRESLKSWGRGATTPFSSDGILTAEEVGGLDLYGTRLTVLSGCQTGAGESRSGEGILGLRRGFLLAGTESLLFTLWPVDDRAAAQFMERFYERLFATNDPFLAFHEVQRERLGRLREEKDLSRAVAQAGGFVLTR